MISRLNFALLTTTALAAACPVAAQAHAAATEPAVEGEIVVTAQRKVERVTDVPISIAVVSQAQAERQQVNTLGDLSRIAPSLEINTATSQNAGGGGSIRGIGTATFSNGAVPSVGVVVDQISQGNANIGDLFDVARIEVLKGPQGTLFGLTTSAGVINISTNAPDPRRISGRLRTQLSAANMVGSEFGQQIVQGVVNLPVSTTSALRVSGFGNFRQGPGINTYTDAKTASDRYGVRGRFLWNATDRLTLNLIGDYSFSRGTSGGDFFTVITAPQSVATSLAGCGVTIGEDNFAFCTKNTIRRSESNYGVSAQVDYKADPFTITSITAHRGNRVYQNTQDIFRAYVLPVNILNAPTDQKIDLWTQELRLSSSTRGRLDYTAGLFLSDSRTLVQPQATIRVLTVPGVQTTLTPGQLNHVRDQSAAIFGQLTYRAMDKLRVILGARYTSEILAVDSTNPTTMAVSSARLSTGEPSVKLGIQYDLAPRVMTYATYAHGYKGGQISTPTSGAAFIINPELPDSYEAGLKATLPGGLIMDLNAFYQKVRGYQSQNCVATSSGSLNCVQSNIDGVKTRGVELNFFGNVAPGLNLNTGLIYAQATYPGGFVGTDGIAIGGRQLALAPKWKFTFSGDYTHRLTDAFEGFVSVDANYKSRVWYQQDSWNTSFRPHWVVGGRIGAKDGAGRYEMALFVRNLFNVHEPVIMQNNVGTANGYTSAIYGPGSARQVGLTFDAKL